MGYAIVFIGGGLGAALRHGVNLGAARWLHAGFPFGTLIVNVSGSLIMGLIAGYFAFKGDASQNWRLFLTTGILGGYTTFPPSRSTPRYFMSAARSGWLRAM
jgi:CrcB protein